MLGLHPTDINPANYRQVLSDMEHLLDAPDHPYIAIGEVGLDLYWDTSLASQQEETFRRQIEWSIRHHLPLSIHAQHTASSSQS